MEKKFFKAAVVETTKIVEAQARDIALHKMTEDKEDRSKNWFKKHLDRIWKHNLKQEYNLQKEKKKATKEIIESGNLFMHEEGIDTLKESEDAKNAIIERYTSEYANDILHKNEKEKIENSPALNAEMRDMIRNFVSRSGSASLDRQAFEEAKKRIISKYDKKYTEKGRVHADNLFSIAQEVKDSIDHGEKLDEMDFEVNVTLAQAQEGLNTRVKGSSYDKAVEWTQNSKIGKWLVNTPAFVAAWTIGSKVARSTLSKGAKWLFIGGGSLLAGGLAASKESARIERERAQHLRERAKGMVFTEEDMKRRQEMEKNQYEMRDAKNIIPKLMSDLELAKAGNLSKDSIDQVVSNLADIEARINLGNTKNIDLVRYSHGSKVYKERNDIEDTCARLKVALRKSVTRTEMESDLKREIAVIEAQLCGGNMGIEAKDKIFKTMKRKRVIWAGVRGALVGGAMSFAISEVIPSLHFGGGSHYGFMPSGNGNESLINDVHMQTPDGTNLQVNSDGTFDLVKGDEVIASHLNLDIDAGGHLTDSNTLDLLRQKGITIDSMPTVGAETTETITTEAKDWVHDHPDDMSHIARKDWMDNNTPMYPDPNNPGHLLGADLNERELEWGGVKGTGITEDGKYEMNVKDMFKEGSFHNQISVDAHNEMVNGNLKALLSVSRDSQQFVFKVDIDKNGFFQVDPNSDAGKMLFSNVDGRAVYNGAFVEAAKPLGVGDDGREVMRVLATHIGKDDAHDIIETIKNTTTDHNIRFNIPEGGGDGYDIPIPVLIPPYRRPLERGEYKPNDPLPPVENIPYYMDYNGRGLSENVKVLFEKMRSKTLKENPEAKLDHYKEISQYLEKQDKLYLERVKRLSESTEKMSKECKISICIPVAGHQEGNNIYESLKNYTYQTAKPEEYEIVLYVNHPEKDKAGNILNANETMEAIEKFKKDYPHINVRIMYEALPNSEAKIGKIRKILSDATLVRQHERGKDASDLIMVSSDADNKGIDPKYIQTFIDKFEKDSKVDALLGQLDWDPESYQKYPAIHIGTRLFQYLSVIGRHRTNSMVSSGANSAYRSSIFAGIGGYIDSLEGGEDISIGQAIIKARGDNKKALGFAGTSTRLFTSSRRSIDALKSGLAPVEQWDKGFSAFDDEIRKLTMEGGDAIDYDDPQIQEKLRKSFEYIINRTLDAWEAGEKLGKNSAYYRKAIGWLGIKYKLDTKGDMVITEMKSLVEGLKRYQIEGKLMRDARSGKPEAIEELKRLRQNRVENLPLQSNNFSYENIVNYKTKSRIENVDELINSKNKETIGEYVIAKDFVLSDTSTGKVFLSYETGTNKILVAKEIDTSYMDNLKKLHFWGNETPESFLKKKGFENSKVLLPIKTIEENGKTYRFYEAGDTDLEKYLNVSKKLSLNESISTIVQIAEAVDALNDAGVINVDIAPSNIILTKDSLRLTDLDGAAINLNSKEMSKRDYVAGNRFTMAPELFKTSPNFNKTVDVYAASSNLYKYLSGNWPYDIEEKIENLPHTEKMAEYRKIHELAKIKFPNTIPAPIRTVIKKGMSPESKDRYQSMKEFMSALLSAYDKVKQKETKTIPEDRRENTGLAKELVNRATSDPRLMKVYTKGIERYYNFKSYFTLKKDDPEKAYIDEKYQEYLQISGNEDKNINAFLIDSIEAMESEFAKQMLGIKEKEEKKQTEKKSKAPELVVAGPKKRNANGELVTPLKFIE